MGQEIRGKPAAPALTADPERSIGTYLARQRELRGISLDELATLTRIPRRSLERLESGVFDRAPDGFVRGFVRTVAAALGLDPDEAVMRLLCEPAVDADVEPAGAVWTSPMLRWAALALAFLLAAGAIGWLAAGLRERAGAPRADEVVIRRDPVRELAREVGQRAGETGEQAAAPGGPAPTDAGGSATAREPAALDSDTAPSDAEAPDDPEAPPAAPAPAP